MKRVYSVTLILVFINIGMYLLQFLLGDVFTASLMLVPEDVLLRPWTLFTSMFLHSPVSPMHLLFNMYVLFIFGGLIEQRIGSKRFLWVYLFAGVFAGALYSVFSEVPALGASGAIMAVLGLAIMLLPDLRVLFFFVIPMSLRTAGILFALVDIFGLFYPGSGIAHLAHLGGLFVGLVYGYYLIKKRKKFVNRFLRVEKPKRRSGKSRGSKETIELSDDDLEEYVRSGRI